MSGTSRFWHIKQIIKSSQSHTQNSTETNNQIQQTCNILAGKWFPYDSIVSIQSHTKYTEEPLILCVASRPKASFKAGNWFIKFEQSLALEEVCLDKTWVRFYSTSAILTHVVPHLQLQVADSTVCIVCCYWCIIILSSLCVWQTIVSQPVNKPNSTYRTCND